MGWSYNPKDASDCLEAGEYTAQLDSIEEKVSKSSGNPMLEVVWVIVANGRDWHVYDYIVNPSTLWKLKKIARAWAMGAEFDEGVFDLTEHKGRTIGLKLTVDSQEGYSDKNSIKDYFSANGKTPQPAKTPAFEYADNLPPPPAGRQNEDIPF